jgi:hypothetical protein
LNREARVGEEDRFREDPSMVDIATTISGFGRKQSKLDARVGSVHREFEVDDV